VVEKYEGKSQVGRPRRRWEHNIICTLKKWNMRWSSWLRDCVTSRKTAGSIPSGVTGIFN